MAATLSNTIVISMSAVSWAVVVPFICVGRHIYCASWRRNDDGSGAETIVGANGVTTPVTTNGGYVTKVTMRRFAELCEL